MPTFFWVLLELCRERRKEDDVSVPVLPGDAEDLTDQLQGLLFRHFRARGRLLQEEDPRQSPLEGGGRTASLRLNSDIRKDIF